MAYFILVPEATLLLVGTKIRDSGNVQFSEHAKSDRLVFLTLSMRRMTGNSRTSGVGTSQRFPEVAILGADQKERGLWGGEWRNIRKRDKCNLHLKRLPGYASTQNKNAMRPIRFASRL